jgi:hypothetical protein
LWFMCWQGPHQEWTRLHGLQRQRHNDRYGAFFFACEHCCIVKICAGAGAGADGHAAAHTNEVCRLCGHRGRRLPGTLQTSDIPSPSFLRLTA